MDSESTTKAVVKELLGKTGNQWVNAKKKTNRF